MGTVRVRGVGVRVRPGVGGHLWACGQVSRGVLGATKMTTKPEGNRKPLISCIHSPLTHCRHWFLVPLGFVGWAVGFRHASWGVLLGTVRVRGVGVRVRPGVVGCAFSSARCMENVETVQICWKTAYLAPSGPPRLSHKMLIKLQEHRHLQKRIETLYSF